MVEEILILVVGIKTGSTFLQSKLVHTHIYTHTITNNILYFFSESSITELNTAF